ncbi:hypothetical protein BO71DRAFT_489426 [Aspergillus ellipticus CBS 707.79]|uniref:Uncharacterized protein n=1 Tax=Aspergillus ellipticus CBS 707.79 TaxID=1448320 RepID=A0A319CQH5_9EURO|nr:hypothetical protein BO71DRAFT_489426 [Aspergillus ellipticus CBS 707.79]
MSYKTTTTTTTTNPLPISTPLPSSPIILRPTRRELSYSSGSISINLINIIHSICSAHSLPILEFTFCIRRQVYHLNRREHFTALIFARRTGPLQRAWIAIAKAVHGFLVSQGVREIVVEILDPMVEVDFRWMPCGERDPGMILECWEEVRKRVWEEVWALGRHRGEMVVEEDWYWRGMAE